MATVPSCAAEQQQQQQHVWQQPRQHQPSLGLQLDQMLIYEVDLVDAELLAAAAEAEVAVAPAAGGNDVVSRTDCPAAPGGGGGGAAAPLLPCPLVAGDGCGLFLDDLASSSGEAAAWLLPCPGGWSGHHSGTGEVWCAAVTAAAAAAGEQQRRTPPSAAAVWAPAGGGDDSTAAPSVHASGAVTTSATAATSFGGTTPRGSSNSCGTYSYPAGFALQRMGSISISRALDGRASLTGGVTQHEALKAAVHCFGVDATADYDTVARVRSGAAGGITRDLEGGMCALTISSRGCPDSGSSSACIGAGGGSLTLGAAAGTYEQRGPSRLMKVAMMMLPCRRSFAAPAAAVVTDAHSTLGLCESDDLIDIYDVSPYWGTFAGDGQQR